jgi:hypothetical protein
LSVHGTGDDRLRQRSLVPGRFAVKKTKSVVINAQAIGE